MRKLTRIEEALEKILIPVLKEEYPGLRFPDIATFHVRHEEVAGEDRLVLVFDGIERLREYCNDYGVEILGYHGGCEGVPGGFSEDLTQP